MGIVFTSFKHPKLPISIKISCHSTANCLYLHDNYISKFKFKNYLFANLLVVWLYVSCICSILAHRIRISEILPWDRKSYLTQAILPRLSREGYIHWLHWNSRTWSSNEVIHMLKWGHHKMSYLSILRNFWAPFSNIKCSF